MHGLGEGIIIMLVFWWVSLFSQVTNCHQRSDAPYRQGNKISVHACTIQMMSFMRIGKCQPGTKLTVISVTYVNSNELNTHVWHLLTLVIDIWVYWVHWILSWNQISQAESNMASANWFGAQLIIRANGAITLSGHKYHKLKFFICSSL